LSGEKAGRHTACLMGPQSWGAQFPRTFRAMYYGLYFPAAGANAQSQKVEVLSNNLANVDTVGFKREIALLEAREAEAIERGLPSRGTGQLEDIGGGVRLRATHTDFSPGTLQRTQIP